MGHNQNTIPETEPAATLIINADDWGMRPQATDRILDCLLRGAISSTSATVFMGDSERAADLAREHHVDAGLHLNLTEPFTGARVPSELVRRQQRISRFLRASRFAPMFFHPLLVSSFDYVIKAQMEEFARLYGTLPNRVDGHHHMHLCANVQWQKLLPAGIIVRRNFTFAAGEKDALNRFYRRMQDRALARRHRIADYFYNLRPIDERRLRGVIRLGRDANVELEVHPEHDAEYEFLFRGRLQELGRVIVVRGYQFSDKGEFVSQEFAEARRAPARAWERSGGAAPAGAIIPHISVCICTYKRPEPLKRLLGDLNRQRTGGLFTYSIVVADNDETRSGEAAVDAMRAELRVPVKYCVEAQRGIAWARNRVLANSEGEYVALIDDDEFPVEDWLLQLFLARERYGVDGVLGPVKRHFDGEPPAWLKRSRLYDRAVNPTGMRVAWRGARTGNVLMKREVFLLDEMPFQVEFKSGEDQDFFRRKIGEGRKFVWSAEAVAYEVLPPARWKRTYYMRKALLHGGYAAMQPDCGAVSVIKSLVAVPVYALGLPFALLGGQHRFMTLLVKLCDHAGKLLFLAGIRPIREEYVSE
jgi:predicted glycoside hydrolase/deacetylase ChbG (UPF0249 family)